MDVKTRWLRLSLDHSVSPGRVLATRNRGVDIPDITAHNPARNPSRQCRSSVSRGVVWRLVVKLPGQHEGDAEASKSRLRVHQVYGCINLSPASLCSPEPHASAHQSRATVHTSQQRGAKGGSTCPTQQRNPYSDRLLPGSHYHKTGSGRTRRREQQGRL